MAKKRKPSHVNFVACMTTSWGHYEQYTTKYSHTWQNPLYRHFVTREMWFRKSDCWNYFALASIDRNGCINTVEQYLQGLIVPPQNILSYSPTMSDHNCSCRLGKRVRHYQMYWGWIMRVFMVNIHQRNTWVSAQTCHHDSSYIISFLTHNE